MRPRKNSASQFVSNVTDDLLSEILIRLPNCRDAVQCKSVCKRWCSLISSPLFIHRFIHQKSLVSNSHLSMLLFQRHSYEDISMPYPFGSEDRSMPYPFDSQFCQIFPEKLKIFRESFLNFLPCDVVIRASFHDLLLVSQSSNPRDLYICNPLTRKWHALPQAPLGNTDYYRCGLVCLPYNCNKREKCTTSAHYKYKVVVFQDDDCECPDQPPVVAIFCSETAQWSELVDLRLPPPLKRWTQISGQPWSLNQIVVCNGILHWLESSHTLCWEGIVAFDPFTDVAEKRCSFIDLPLDINHSRPFNMMAYICLGTFRGRLRLSQLTGDYGLKVWELGEYYQNAETSWSLVPNVSLTIGLPRTFLLALDPSNSSVVFLFCNNELFRCDMSEGKNENFGQFPVDIVIPSMSLSIFHLMHSSWPTPVPALPL
ncbi:hypothetical protein UlMin_028699 [Ulmus minor]